MDTLVGFGIVLHPSENTIEQIENVLDLVDSYTKECEITHPKEGDYNDWKTERVTGSLYDIIDKLAYRTSYADFVFTLDNRNLDVRLALTNEGDELLLKFEIDEAGLIQSKDHEELQRVTGLMTRVFESVDRNVDYKYMFCDHEAEYIATQERLMELGHQPYAIFKMKDRNTVYAPWFLDGFTLRNNEDV